MDFSIGTPIYEAYKGIVLIKSNVIDNRWVQLNLGLSHNAANALIAELKKDGVIGQYEFDLGYRVLSNDKKTTFCGALTEVKRGKKAARTGWNGKGMWIELYTPSDLITMRGKPILPFIIMKTADEYYVPWLASQTDVLAEDWEIIKQ